MPKTLAWFSCGAASAVASKLAVEKYGDSCEVVYCWTMPTEHPDNRRFFEDVQSWLGRKITVLKSDKYVTVDEVFEKTRYMAGISGARCTSEMKKVPRKRYALPEDLHVFGFTLEETKRISNFEENNPSLACDWLLRDQRITKGECLLRLQEAGIAPPVLYSLGYKNNNCLGCVNATSARYWNMVRRDFPEVFERRVQQSRALGVRLTRYQGKRIFLDELPEGYMSGELENISCGPDCGDTGKT